jgi:hypothetical protein
MSDAQHPQGEREDPGCEDRSGIQHPGTSQKQGGEKALLTIQEMAQKNLLSLEQIERTKKIVEIMRSRKGGCH